MSKATPTVSICIPVYNGRSHIAATLQAVLAQTFGDFELIVVDSASTDGTAEVVATFKDERLRLVRHKDNLGMTGNWNRAVRECAGRYMKLLCADDLLYPTCLAQQVAVLENPAHANVVLTVCRRDIVDENGQMIFRSRGFPDPCGSFAGKDVLRRIVRTGRNLFGEPMTGLFRADAFARTIGYEGEQPYYIDMSMWCQLLLLGDVHVLDQTLGAFRVSPFSQSSAMARLQARQGRQFFKRLRAKSPELISRADVFLGCTRCTIEAFLRQLVYVYLRRTRKQT